MKTTTEKEELVGEPNTEPVNFRVPKSLKEALKDMAEYEMVASVGELLRTIARAHIQQVTNSRAYKNWQERMERERQQRRNEASR